MNWLHFLFNGLSLCFKQLSILYVLKILSVRLMCLDNAPHLTVFVSVTYALHGLSLSSDVEVINSQKNVMWFVKMTLVSFVLTMTYLFKCDQK